MTEKNNQGAFIVTALNKDAIASDKPECFFVKVVRELNNFKDLIKRQEGVETQKEIDLLKQWGVDLVQGYYYTKPLDSEQIIHKLEEDVC